MSKKKHPEHVNHERWLVSYADFITLLFAFFVVLFAAGQTDKRKQVQLAIAMQSAFTHDGIFDQHSKTPPIAQDAAVGRSSKPAPFGLPIPTPQELAQKRVQEHVSEVMKKAVERKRLAAGAISMHTTDDGLVISLREAGFFPSGSADVRAGAEEIVAEVASALPDQAIHVEGHTDNVPIHNQQFATNWELSTARAATITRMVLAAGKVSPKLISATGFAEYQPAASNATEEGRAQNRRVDIILLKRPESSQ
ncbi:chemotaxis protein MotB [Granulicella rosea]|uniref:Chemotaxis protein MotB n=1 Tax=Granulicella rosea TaxID=474952 RepID=A0A239IV90_9BACT|nr:flagellar motor protein MotB [Granulicella rosea]SNS96334.1 chemotaxis protein MotB [Granulicella rosea]